MLARGLKKLILKIVLFGGLAAKTDPPLLVGKISQVSRR